MYDKIGDKIQTLAKALGIIDLAAGAICALVGLVIGFGGDGWWVFLGGIFGGAAGYVGTWTLYGFGQLVNDVHALRNARTGAQAPSADEIPDI